MKITRIAIKGASGYGPVDESYDDKVIITPSSISSSRLGSVSKLAGMHFRHLARSMTSSSNLDNHEAKPSVLILVLHENLLENPPVSLFKQAPDANGEEL